MRAGALRKRVSVQSVGSVLDNYGDLSDSWTTDAVVWASIHPLTGLERETARELAGIVTHKVKIRYREGLTASNRVTYSGRTFQIESVKNWEHRDIFLELLCKEVTT